MNKILTSKVGTEQSKNYRIFHNTKITIKDFLLCQKL